MSLVKRTADGRLCCGGCGETVRAEYKAQDPAPCGCAWVWTDDGKLEAVPTRAGRWRCVCGRELDEPSRAGRSVAICECGRLWTYDYWQLNRWDGDTGCTPLEPRWTAGKPEHEPSAA